MALSVAGAFLIVNPAFAQRCIAWKSPNNNHRLGKYSKCAITKGLEKMEKNPGEKTHQQNNRHPTNWSYKRNYRSNTFHGHCTQVGQCTPIFSTQDTEAQRRKNLSK
jgi:hypothetical protein